VKVLLIQPPIEDYYDTSIRTYPLSLLYIATKVREICDVSIADLRSNRKPRQIIDHPFPELAPYYRKDRYTPISLFKQYSRFGADLGEIRQRIVFEKPDVVAVSSLFSAYSGEAMDIARCAKEVDDKIITVAGGIHPTLFPEHVLQSPFVDYVVRGEGETPFSVLIEAIKKGTVQSIAGTGGIASKHHGRCIIPDIHIEENLDLVPDRRLVNPSEYRIGKKKYTFFLTSRGCPFHCAFCGRPPFPYRARGLGSVEKEIADCLSLDIQAVDFEDDMLTLDRLRFQNILGLFRGTGLTLSAMNGIYSENLDVATLERMYESGFRRLNFSLVDASASVTNRQKRHNTGNFAKLLPYLEASHFLVETHFIIGLPEQRVEHILDTIIFLMGKKLLLGPSIFYLAPNSSVYSRLAPDLQDTNHYFKLMRSSAMVPLNPSIPRDSLYTLMKLVRFVNLVKGLLDGSNVPTRLSDILELPAVTKNDRDRQVLSALLNEKQLIWFDSSHGTFLPEPHSSAIVRLFFHRAKNKSICGFKTRNRLVVD